MEVYFITHGSAEIGMGHVMRSLSLATAFCARKHKVCFFSKYQLGISKIKEQGFKVNCIPALSEKCITEEYYFEKDEEILKDAKYISNNIVGIADAVLVDSYNVNEMFFNILKEKTRKLVYIDDLNAFYYPVDILINGSASAFDMGYENIQSAQLLLGLRYNLLRKEFYHIPVRNVNLKIENILITTGNSDPYHMTERVVNILKGINAFSGLKLHVIIGSGFTSNALFEIDQTINSGILLYENPVNMAEIMLGCDLAITAGGSTLYELFACGVPAIVFAYAENQMPQIKALEKESLLTYIGNYQDLDRRMLKESIRYMQLHYEERKKLVMRIQNTVDAKGALRVVEELENTLSGTGGKDGK